MAERFRIANLRAAVAARRERENERARAWYAANREHLRRPVRGMTLLPPQPTRPDPGLSKRTERRTRDQAEARRRQWLLVTGLFLGFALGIAFGFVMGDAGTIDPSGHAGEVYVVDSGEWVDADDHGAHEGHG